MKAIDNVVTVVYFCWFAVVFPRILRVITWMNRNQPVNRQAVNALYWRYAVGPIAFWAFAGFISAFFLRSHQLRLAHLVFLTATSVIFAGWLPRKPSHPAFADLPRWKRSPAKHRSIDP